MAREKKTRRPKDPEGRMALGEHLTELRNRLVWCAVTILLLSIIGWFLYPRVFSALQQPFRDARAMGMNANLNFDGVGKGLSAQLAMSAYVGLILSAPMVIFQIWSFITPGLHRNERRYVIGFFGSAVPLFFIGCVAGYYMLNKAVPILMEFTPQLAGVIQNINYADYLNLLVKTVLAFGIAFTFPVFLVLFNFMGILPGRSMLKAWRWVTLLCFTFCAVMVPTPDPFTMIFMATPMVALYFAAVVIGLLHDRRRAAAEDTEIDDETASTIDDEVEAVGPASSLDGVDER